MNRWTTTQKHRRRRWALARTRNGDETGADDLRRQIGDPGDPQEAVRGAAVLIGALGGFIAEQIDPLPEIDTTQLVGGVLRRMRTAQVVVPETLPFAGGVLTAALVARIDTLAWLDEVGIRTEHAAPMIEVLAELMSLTDTLTDRPGAATDLISTVLSTHNTAGQQGADTEGP